MKQPETQEDMSDPAGVMVSDPEPRCALQPCLSLFCPLVGGRPQVCGGHPQTSFFSRYPFGFLFSFWRQVLTVKPRLASNSELCPPVES